MTKPSGSQDVPSTEEILQRLREAVPPPGPVNRLSITWMDDESLRGELEDLASGIAQIRALIRPPRDLPPALHRIPILRLGPIRRLLLRGFEILFRRQMLINEQLVVALDIERRLIGKVVQNRGS